MANLEIKLEKNAEAKLDATEQQALNALAPKAFEAQVNQIKTTKFDLSDKTKGVTLDTIVRNYNTATKQIEINGETIPVKWGSDLAAWMQILMIADKRSVWSVNEKTRGIDGKIGNKTSGVIDDYKDGTTINTKTTPNQPEGNVDLSITDITQKLKDDIMESIAQVGLKSVKGDKFQKQFARASKNGILDANYKVRGADINTKTKEYVIRIIKQKTGLLNKEYRIRLDKILKTEEGVVDKAKFASQIYLAIGLIYKDIIKNQQSIDTKTEKENLKNLTNKWNTLQKKATNHIKNAKTWVNKINITQEYSKAYANKEKEIRAIKPTYTKAEYIKLANQIKNERNKLNQANILTNCPNWIRETYNTWVNNIGRQPYQINTKSVLTKYINEADSIIKWQQTYEKSGMVKMPQLTQSIKGIREKLVNQQLYLTSKTYLDNDYNTLYKKLNTRDPEQRGKAKKERTQKFERLKAGTYKYSNQPSSCKTIFEKANKAKEYTNYISKFDVLMAS